MTTEPRQKRAKESKDKILESAIEVFAENGPDGARVDEIEARAGINKQRIYAYFGSKDNLYRNVLLKVYAQAAENRRLLNLGEADLSELTERIIEAFFDFHQDNPLFWRLLAWENLKGGTSLRDEDWENIQSKYIAHLKKLYEKGQDMGVFSEEIGFNSYIIAIFAVSFFYYSNQLTISHLLNLEMRKDDFRASFVSEVKSLLTRGCL